MTEPTYIAGTLRRCGIEIPNHIPDHAWIYQRDTQGGISCSRAAGGKITSVMCIPTFPPDKFHYQREHGNARLLVSRNRREGLYCGFRNGHYRLALHHFSIRLATLQDRKIFYAYSRDGYE